MPREGKVKIIDELGEIFTECSIGILTDYRGLSTAEITDLRRALRSSGIKYRVVKNTLALRALENSQMTTLGPHCKGMTGLAYAESDPIALAKVLNDFSRAVPALTFKGGVVSGKELDPEAFKEAADRLAASMRELGGVAEETNTALNEMDTAITADFADESKN